MPDTVSPLSSSARDLHPSPQIYQQQPQQQQQLWPQQPWPQQRQQQTPPPQNFEARVGRRQPEQASQNMEPALLQLAAQIKALMDQQAAQQAMLMQVVTQQASPNGGFFAAVPLQCKPKEGTKSFCRSNKTKNKRTRKR
jgi:hypothetical protein